MPFAPLKQVADTSGIGLYDSERMVAHVEIDCPEPDRYAWADLLGAAPELLVTLKSLFDPERLEELRSEQDEWDHYAAFHSPPPSPWKEARREDAEELARLEIVAAAIAKAEPNVAKARGEQP